MVFTRMEPFLQSIITANGSTLEVTGRGTVELEVTCEDGETITITLRNVLYSRESPYQLLSVGCLLEAGGALHQLPRAASMQTPHGDVIPLRLSGKLIYLPTSPVVNAALASPAAVPFDVWHARLGYLHPEAMKVISKQIADMSVMVAPPVNTVSTGKGSTNLTPCRRTDPIDFEVLSLSKHKYALVIVDRLLAGVLDLSTSAEITDVRTLQQLR
jgi:hypothetical protein